jgi:low temperature requirement protein LtrA
VPGPALNSRSPRSSCSLIWSFVFAVTQLSHHLLDHLTMTGAAQTAMLLLVVWLAWVTTTWVTNWFDPDRLSVRLMLVWVMLASLFMSVAIPEAFGDRARCLPRPS